MKKIFQIIAILAFAPAVGAQMAVLSDYDASQIIGGGTPDSCGDDSFSCPYQDLGEESTCKGAKFFCKEWTSWDKCKKVCADDPCRENKQAYCTMYNVTGAKWVSVLGYSYCSYTVSSTTNCTNSGFPKNTCE